ncbi:MAG: hypothetical protein H6Q20_2374 [Bacteroidetes bacterium]|nr:hypothetical protein [Bacteroidota bacterium]
MATSVNYRAQLTALIVLLLCAPLFSFAGNNSENFTEYKGIVTDKSTGKVLPFANVVVEKTNIATVTNTEGEFSIKIPDDIESFSVSFIGYKSKMIHLKAYDGKRIKVEMEPIILELPEVSVISKDATALVQAMMQKRNENYSVNEMSLTAFYRETIKKNRSYASLSEAVVDVYKQPYTSYKMDVVKLYKSRKKADYNKLDTLVFKLMGGPFNSLYLDLMKNPEMVFTEDMLKNYEFSFDRSTRSDDRLIYVIDFKQSDLYDEPLYYGKLYIDAQSLALKSAVFKLNISNRDAASKMFIVKKPLSSNVYPVEASYRIDYLENNGKWYYGYSRIELGLRINWKKKLFNTTYYSTIEMAVTDRESTEGDKPVSRKERLRPTVVISDEASGFSDPDFWGEYNVIEPEKSIESAIKKIQKQLQKKD